ncbi:MAG: hypothetical protein HYX65_08570 [Gemmatimonadetes bacterium]|nr:hypothetical protein [Gemmatimonadota bacterium]
MINHRQRALIAALAALVVVPALQSQLPRPSQAQVDRMSGPMFGLRGVYDGDGRVWGYGAQARFPIDWNLQFAPSVDAYAVNGQASLQGNVDFIATGRRGWFYVGGGLAVARTQGIEARYGANLYPGIDLPSLFDTPLRPFVEARWTFIDGKAPFRLTFGLNFPLGSR